jgi:hypothetical protein
MTQAPKRIWAEPSLPGYTCERNEVYTVEYIRADLSADLVRAALKSIVAKMGQLEVDQHNNCKSEDYSDGISDCFNLAVKMTNDPDAVAAIVAKVMEGK